MHNRKINAWSVVCCCSIDCSQVTVHLHSEIHPFYFSYEWDQKLDKKGQRNILYEQIVDPPARIDIL